jgi:hypothetical protein
VYAALSIKVEFRNLVDEAGLAGRGFALSRTDPGPTAAQQLAVWGMRRSVPPTTLSESQARRMRDPNAATPTDGT